MRQTNSKPNIIKTTDKTDKLKVNKNILIRNIKNQTNKPTWTRNRDIHRDLVFSPEVGHHLQVGAVQGPVGSDVVRLGLREVVQTLENCVKI